MPMTRAEKDKFEALRTRAALSWPPKPPEPVDSASLRGGENWGRGWWANPAARRVGEGVTNGTMHSRDPATDEQLANRHATGSRLSLSQGAGGPWYLTKTDALRALHWAVAKQCAEELADIERWIEESQ